MSDIVEMLRTPTGCVSPSKWELAAAAEIERLRDVLSFARRRIVYYGTISDRRHFDHDLAEVYPVIDAALSRSR